MFTLINSAILFTAAALGIPLLIHLLNRRKRRRIPYSSLRFLKFLEKQRIRRLSLYQYLLILIRTLIILMLMLAFARPVYDSAAGTAGTRAAATAVIILDDGLSMRGFDGGVRKFDGALARLDELLASYTVDDRVFILAAAQGAPVPADSVERGGLVCGYGVPDLHRARAAARQAIAGHANYTREIHIISDFATAGGSFLDSCRADQAVRYFFHRIGTGAMVNAGIDSLVFTSRILERNKEAAVEVVVRNHGPAPRDGVGVHLYARGKRLAYQTITLGPYESGTAVLKFRPPGAGLVDGYVELPDDDLAEDNRYYFAFYIPERIRVLFVDDAPSVYLTSALQSIANTTGIEFVFERFGSWGRQLLSEYDLVILANLPALTPQLAARVVRFTGDGGGLILIPGDNTTAGALAEVTAAFGGIFTAAGAAGAGGFITLQPPAPGDPLFADLFRSSAAAFAPPEFYRYFRLRAGPDAGMRLDFRNRDPFFISGAYGSGFAGIFAAYFDRTWTDLPFRGIFAPFLSRIIYLGVTRASGRVLAVRSGGTAAPELLSSAGADFRFTPPGQEPYGIVPVRRANRLIFELPALNVPGNYRLSSEAADLRVISVNPGLLPPAGPGDLLAGADAGNLHVLTGAAGVAQYRSGLELTALCLLLALLLFGAELYLVKRTEGGGAGVDGHGGA